MQESKFLKDNIQNIQKLKDIPSLKNFTTDDLSRLLKLSKIKQYSDGETIIKEGTSDEWLYFLVSGQVRISKKNKELAVLRRMGEIFGEMGIVDNSIKSASVTAIGNVVCLSADTTMISKMSGQDYLTFHYLLYRAFTEFLADRLRAANEEILRLETENNAMKAKSTS